MKAKTELLQNSLPLICAGLGDKLDVRIKVQGNQASTNGNTIVIPDFKVATKEDKDAVLGFASHEAAHIKFNSWKDITREDMQECTAMRKAMWNIFEDLRIESEMIKAMIGTRKWIDQIWINRQKEGTRPAVTSECAPTSILQDYLLFTCRVKYREQKHLQPYLDAATDAFIDVLGWKLQMQLDDVVHEHLPKLISSRSAFDLAIQVEQLINKHEPDEPQQPKEPEQQSSNEESSEGDTGDSGETNSSDSSSDTKDEQKGEGTNDSDSKPDSSGEEKPEGEGTSDSDSEPDSLTNPDSSSASNGEEGDSKDGPQTPTSTAPLNTPSTEDIKKAIEALTQATEGDFKDDMEQFVSQMAKLAQANEAQSQVGIPDIQWAKDLVDTNNSYSSRYGRSLESDVKRNSNMLTAKLQGLVQEDIRVRAKNKDRGQRINTKLLHRVTVGNPKVFKSKSHKKEIDTIVEIMVDNSGSMVCNRTSNGETLMNGAKKAQLSLALALDKLQGVTVTASAFPTGENRCSNVIELLSEGEPVKKLAPRLSIVKGNGDNTPSASAMWHSLRKVVESNKQRKIILFVTDGCPNADQAKTLGDLVVKAEKNGIVVIGIAIGEIADYKSKFYKFFSNAIFIQDAKELKNEMFKVAHNLISG
ncbi:hypothetical protein AB4562_04650 [Vibrio sp. 10N.222.54.A1]|uniref:hypothetical protein n=1 Tax=unclassified Vibrio TaxID=2614977 RepID=UPI00354BFF2A